MTSSAQHLLQSEEVRERVVESSLLGQPCAVRIHSAQRVVAVGAAKREALSHRHCRRAEVIVIGTSHARDGKVVLLERQCELHVTGHIVQSAHL